MRGYAMLGLSALYLAGSVIARVKFGDDSGFIAFCGFISLLVGGAFLAIDGKS